MIAARVCTHPRREPQPLRSLKRCEPRARDHRRGESLRYYGYWIRARIYLVSMPCTRDYLLPRLKRELRTTRRGYLTGYQRPIRVYVRTYRNSEPYICRARGERIGASHFMHRETSCRALSPRTQARVPPTRSYFRMECLARAEGAPPG